MKTFMSYWHHLNDCHDDGALRFFISMLCGIIYAHQIFIIVKKNWASKMVFQTLSHTRENNYCSTWEI
jgi:hypothetical protein